MSNDRIDEVFEQGDSPPEERLIESTPAGISIPAEQVEFVGYDTQGKAIRYNDKGIPLTN